MLSAGFKRQIDLMRLPENVNGPFWSRVDLEW
jgi:hypothetical protein